VTLDRLRKNFGNVINKLFKIFGNRISGDKIKKKRAGCFSYQKVVPEKIISSFLCVSVKMIT